MKNNKKLLVGSLILVASGAQAEVAKSSVGSDAARSTCITKLTKSTLANGFPTAPVSVQAVQDGRYTFIVDVTMNQTAYTAEIAASCSNKNYLKDGVYSYSEATCKLRTDKASLVDQSYQLTLRNKNGEVIYNFSPLTESNGGC